MPYIPKKLVNTGLYATGDTFIDASTGKPYRGPYHSNFNGTIFSGKDPYDPNKKLLARNPNKSSNIRKTKVVNSPTNRQYERLNQNNSNLLRYGNDPKSFTPKPTTKDYQRGSILRYFAKRITEKPNRIIEIDSNSYNSIVQKDGRFNYAVWRVFSVLWRISGKNEDEAIRTNNIQVDNANRKFRGIKSYLRNPLQFYKKREDVVKPSRILPRGEGRRILEPSSQRPSPRQNQGGGSRNPRRDLY
tara:strand:- start:125 stop:859 length:735 start_codon:yes stop_codon:yes gene_type:complete